MSEVRAIAPGSVQRRGGVTAYVPGVLNGGCVLTGPSVDGEAGHVLTTDGAGRLMFVNPATASQGPPGEAGDPGPNVVTTSTETNLTGLLAGDGGTVYVVDPATFASAIHTHAISDVTNLQTSLDGKAATAHTHTASAITDLSTAISSGIAAAGIVSAVSPLTLTAHSASETALTLVPAASQTAALLRLRQGGIARLESPNDARIVEIAINDSGNVTHTLTGTGGGTPHHRFVIGATNICSIASIMIDVRRDTPIRWSNLASASAGNGDARIAHNNSDSSLSLQIGATISIKADADTTAGNTRFQLYDNNTSSLQRVKVGANNTGPGGVGRALYVDNA